MKKEPTILECISTIHFHYYFNYSFEIERNNDESLAKLTNAAYTLHKKLPIIAYMLIGCAIALAKLRTIPLFKKMDDGFRNLKVWIHDLIHPHNQIKIQKLPRTWCDTDEKMFHAVMQLVVDFVEKEEPYGKDFSKGAMKKYMKEFITDFDIFKDEHGAGESLKRQREISLQIIDMYEWYKYDLDMEEKMVYRAKTANGTILDEPYDEAIDDGTIDCFVDSEHDNKLRRTKTLMLYKAIKLRGSMWT